MSGFVDLHCHWIAGIDDGARTVEEGIAMLEALGRVGFARVVATPHMRPGMFDNDKASLTAAYERMLPHLRGVPGLPEVGLSSEHYFDDVVYQRLLNGEGLPYPGRRAVLLEFYDITLPAALDRHLFTLQSRGLLPVIAHPERYHPIWRSPETLERLVEAGAAALLDVAALAGKYGQKPQRTAEELLERGLYHAACSDAHRPADADAVLQGMQHVEKRYG
ncbi:MAG TPA: CpsB/CapC family capsule biosynthesis tyrosine phosphatase, partial [Polyangiaceae bacterium]|nr:CpsB/CapC family capsule biosynthesis tyrosine phosphatase [Polyangiaceae bacterium]